MTLRGWRTVASNVLCFVGLMGTVGHVTGLFPLTILGQQRYIVSPVPIVFSQAAGRETIGARFSVRVENDSGEIYEFDHDGRGFAHHLQGPFLRRVSYVARALYFKPSGDRQTASIFRYAFCGGPLAFELGIQGQVRSVELHTWSAIDREQLDRKFELECPK